MKTKNGNYTLTMRSIRAICEKLECPLNGWKGGYKAAIKTIESVGIKKSNGRKITRYKITMMDNVVIRTMPEFNKWNSGSVQELTAVFVKKLHEIDNEKLLDDLFDSLKNRELELSDKLPTWGSSPPDCTLEIWSWSPTRVIIGSCADDIEIIDR